MKYRALCTINEEVRSMNIWAQKLEPDVVKDTKKYTKHNLQKKASWKQKIDMKYHTKYAWDKRLHVHINICQEPRTPHCRRRYDCLFPSKAALPDPVWAIHDLRPRTSKQNPFKTYRIIFRFNFFYLFYKPCSVMLTFYILNNYINVKIPANALLVSRLGAAEIFYTLTGGLISYIWLLSSIVFWVVRGAATWNI